MGDYAKKEITILDKLKTALEVIDGVKDILYLFLVPHETINAAILVVSIIAPPIIILSMGCPFSDLYAIGKYNKNRNAGAVLFVKVLENVPQMIVQQQEMFSRGLKVTAFAGGNIIFGSTMLFTSLGWGVGLMLNERSYPQLSVPITGMVAFMIAQVVEFSTHFVSPDQANQHMLSAQSPTTSNAYPSKLWLILPISILITIKGWFDIKKHEKDL